MLLFVKVLEKRCSIITSRMGGGWVSTFLVIMRNRKKRGHEWHLMKDRNVTVKKIYKVFFCTTAARSEFHQGSL